MTATTPCPPCKGAGAFYTDIADTEPCTTCHGEGYVPACTSCESRPAHQGDTCLACTDRYTCSCGVVVPEEAGGGDDCEWWCAACLLDQPGLPREIAAGIVTGVRGCGPLPAAWVERVEVLGRARGVL